MVAIYWMFRYATPASVDHWFRKLQLVSAALFSLNHGANDAQKTMGIIAGVLFTVPAYRAAVVDADGKMFIPFWIVLAAHAAIGLGTLSGGWRIIHTMGSRITKLQPVHGFAAETGAAGGRVHSPRSSAFRCPRRTRLQAPSSVWGRPGACRRCGGASPARSSGRGC